MAEKDESLPFSSPSLSTTHRQPTSLSVSSSAPSSATTTIVMIYAVIFFLCMIIMELTLEGTQRSFNDLPALAFAVTLFQFGCCFLLPVALSKGKTLQEIPKSIKEVLPYITLSLCVFGSSGLATMSIRYVSYPTKVILKSTKLIPTMIVSTLVQRNGPRYGRLEYLAATLLCAGAAGYGFGESTSSSSSSSSSSSLETGNNDEDASYIGIMLLCTSLFCDAFTPNIQQRLMAPVVSTSHDHHGVVETTTTTTSSSPSITTSTWQRQQCRQLQISVFPPGGAGLGVSASTLMTNANLVGGLGILLYMTVTGELVQAVGVASSEPRLFVYLTVIGMSLAVAVFAYTRLIQASGSVVAVAVATLRKVVTVILSYIVYPKTFSKVHAVSSLLVLGGVILSSYAKQRMR